MSACEELALLRASLLPDEFDWRGSTTEREHWNLVLAAYEGGSEPPSSPEFHFAVRLDEQLGLWVNISLQHAGESPRFTITSTRSSGVPLAALDRLAHERVADAENQGLSHRTFDLVMSLQQEARDMQERGELPAEPEPSSSEPQITAPPKQLAMRRVIFWSHHLVAPSKRKELTAWCAELRVWGLLKLGYPGFLCFEGETDDVADIVRRVKGMQWHAISVRVEVDWTADVSEAPSDPHTAALERCALAQGRTDAVRQGGTLRTNCEQVDEMRDFIARLRAIHLDESEIQNACHMRTGQ